MQLKRDSPAFIFLGVEKPGGQSPLFRFCLFTISDVLNMGKDQLLIPERNKSRTNLDREDMSILPFVDGLNDNDTMAMARRLSRGMPVATPVFEGVTV